MIKYRTGSVRWSVDARIDIVEVARESDRSIWFLDGRRELKNSEYQAYHDTWDEAHEYLLRSARDIAVRGELEFARAKLELAAVEAMSSPKEDVCED